MECEPEYLKEEKLGEGGKKVSRAGKKALGTQFAPLHAIWLATASLVWLSWKPQDTQPLFTSGSPSTFSSNFRPLGTAKAREKLKCYTWKEAKVFLNTAREQPSLPSPQ